MNNIRNPFVFEYDHILFYRAIFVGNDGQIKHIIDVEATSDAEAIKFTETMVDSHAIDLWEGLRYIEHFPVKK